MGGGASHARQAWIIAKFTDNGFVPRPSDLAAIVEGLEYEEPDGLSDVTPLHTFQVPDPHRPTVLLITEENCRPEDFDPTTLNLVGCATQSPSHLGSPLPILPLVEEFGRSTLKDAALRVFHGAQGTRRITGVPEMTAHPRLL